MRPVIPKRGEKEYEPRAGVGNASSLQQHVLDRSRNAMFETLRATRTTSSKAISYAIWHPSLSRAEVTLNRGIHFSSMGHSAPRTIPTTSTGGTPKVHKRLELLPEEAIYLIERGSLFCWKWVEGLQDQLAQDEKLENVAGAPMSVQQAYAEMIGKEDLTLEKFQVFAYLRRLGYVVTRTEPPTPYYPVPPPLTLTSSKPTILQRIRRLFTTCLRTFTNLFTRFNWWHPLNFSCLSKNDKNYTHIFRSLRFIPSGHSVPLKNTTALPPSSPYKIFYNIYKPSTPFKKSNPPPPDFQMVVVNARTTPIPTLQELTYLFDISPELPPPVPRQRYNPLQGKPPKLKSKPGSSSPKGSSAPGVDSKGSVTPGVDSTATATTSTSHKPTLSIAQRLLPWFFPPPPPQATTTSQPSKPRPTNPFMALKSGKKMVLIAAVDSGNISFFRFSQGKFAEWPMA
ncbi:hypothetical protein CC1G_08024 [Coprinopsis cinerea okayama7|uniref:tRNA-splicing endonuclease subunit Sen54 N-terminal domain-containing protein n=1 Tax=Coprinopsis cinerea (strain Okayama-7 / 130 / ATCC MYA-4618 / FGSC 9003) TaxID=240176 RepID=A8NQA7_COPC7|nr:hypothetical protein CC1G_08024 [Coprinopsis cinerea okayama7\|eukprot:XP_001835515.1 hypothetical protein CC1G_08024 [Coprinopsis cinerea okayama7\